MSPRTPTRPPSELGIFLPRFIGAAIFFLLLVVVGTVGYGLIEGWPVSDSLYMSVITLTAVGYSEVRPLSEAGRTFTMFLLGGGLTWMGLWFAVITSFIVELDLDDVFRRRRIMKDIGRMEDHLIVCGAGRTGRQVAEELEGLGESWVIIDNDRQRVTAVLETIPDAYPIEGDATRDTTLLEAGVEKARGLVACLSGDTDNLFVCLSARHMNPRMTIVARAYEESTMDKMYRAGANHVVSPNVSGAVRMASVLLRPSVVSFLDIATRSSELALRMEQASIDASSPLAGRSLAEARIPQETGLIVIAVRKAKGTGDGNDDFVFNPVADTRLEPGDEMIVLGQEEQIVKLREYVRG